MIDMVYPWLGVGLCCYVAAVSIISLEIRGEGKSDTGLNRYCKRDTALRLVSLVSELLTCLETSQTAVDKLQRDPYIFAGGTPLDCYSSAAASSPNLCKGLG